MKKLMVIAAALAMSLCLFGCGSSGSSSSGAAEEPQEPTPEEQLQAYLDLDLLNKYDEVRKSMSGLVPIFEGTDLEEHAAKCEAAKAVCNEIINTQNVPEAATEAHGYLVTVAENCLAKLIAYEQAAAATDPHVFNGFMDTAGEYSTPINKAWPEAKKAYAALQDDGADSSAAESEKK